MSNFIELLRDKLDSEFYLVNYYKDIPLIIQYYLLKSIYYIDSIVVAKPFTKNGWLLAINTVLSTWRGSKLIVYYNEREPRYTSSIILQELVGKILINEYGEVISVNKFLCRTLSYLSSFISGFRDLYQKTILEYVSKLSVDKITVPEKYISFFIHDLMYVVIPRLLAYRLVNYDYREIVEESISDNKKLIELWLNTKPSNSWVIALSNAFKIIGLNPLNYGLVDTGFTIEKTSNGYRYLFIYINEVDDKYIEMMRILRRAVENRDRIEQILREWWSEIRNLGEIELLKRGFIVPDVFSID